MTRTVLMTALCLGGARLAWADANLLSERGDDARTGARLSETVLTPATVGGGHFGKLWSWLVSGSVQAQPLYMQNVRVRDGSTRNLVFIATMNDAVYAFDADSADRHPVWQRNLAAGATPVPIVDIVAANNENIVGNIGVTSTPAIDPATGTMYLVARTKAADGTYHQFLHALSVATGLDRPGSPVEITASVTGSGAGSSGGMLRFDPAIQNQRMSLALVQGQVLIGWGSHEDLHDWHGWLMTYDAATLRQTGVLCTTPNGGGGSIWMSGHAPAVDADGFVYVTTGNGDYDGSTAFSESLLRLSLNGGLHIDSWFTPTNYAALNKDDADFGASGPLLLPGTSNVMAGGKTGVMYVMPRVALGGLRSGYQQGTQILNTGGEIKGGAVLWDRRGAGGSVMYIWPDASPAKSYLLTSTGFRTTPYAESKVMSASGASNGVLTLSANGTDWTSGVLWSSMVVRADGDHGVHHGVLRALDARNLRQVWNSDVNAARDNAGNWPKFSSPVVANGRVYLASFPLNGTGTGVISVYGLLP